MNLGIHATPGVGEIVELDFNLFTSEDINIYCGATLTQISDSSPATSRLFTLTNAPMLVTSGPKLRELKTAFGGGDEKVSQLSDDITVNCAPLS